MAHGIAPHILILDDKGQMIGNASREGQEYIGKIDGKRYVAHIACALTVAQELNRYAHSIVGVAEPIWRLGVVIC